MNGQVKWWSIGQHTPLLVRRSEFKYTLKNSQQGGLQNLGPRYFMLHTYLGIKCYNNSMTFLRRPCLIVDPCSCRVVKQVFKQNIANIPFEGAIFSNDDNYFRLSVTRCWNKNLPNFFKSCPQQQTKQFLTKVMFFNLAHKVTQENFPPRAFKNCPI